MTSDPEQIVRKRFIRGMLLAWIPMAVVGVCIFRIVRDMSNQKATGIGILGGVFQS